MTARWQRGNRMWHILRPEPSTYTMCGTSVSGPHSEYPESAIRCKNCQINCAEMLDKARRLLADYADVTCILRRKLSLECTSCGAFVDRGRPPQPGEGVYCTRPPCRREQQRRNMAAWRASKRETA